MPTPDEERDQVERDLEIEQARSDALKKRADALDEEVEPASSPIDHARDGGVF